VGEGEGAGVGVALGNGEGVGETVGEGLGVGWVVAPEILPLAHPVRQIKITQLNTGQKTRNNHLLLMGPIPYTECFIAALPAFNVQMPRAAGTPYGLMDNPAGKTVLYGLSTLKDLSTIAYCKCHHDERE
jgi:hypothetical protein